MKTLALVPAKGRSTGLPGKNGRVFNGRPLISWALDIGHLTCDETYLSTNDPDLGVIGFQSGSGLIARPEHLCQDETPMIDVIQHALKELRHVSYDAVVLLQPTSPLRTADQVRQALHLLKTKEADSVVSVVRVPQHMSPDYVGVLYGERGYGDRIVFPVTTRRQDTKPAYYRDGTVYVFRPEFILEGTLYGHKCIPMILKPEESATIDTEEDWQRAESLV